MKILLVGPYPPPHGGISTHVAELRRQWTCSGFECRVLDAGRVDACFMAELLRRGALGWKVHIHTNGHNRNSWLLAFICGMAGARRSSELTLHSGMAPRYLEKRNHRRLARCVCGLFSRVVCVNSAIRNALVKAGVPAAKLEVKPAFIGPPRGGLQLNPLLRAWMTRHSPVFSTALFFRPEYGFDFLAAALAELRGQYPALGCVVMGSGEQQREAERLVRRLGLEDNIFLTGDVSHETCLAAMSRSDVFLRPTFEDGDSISVREALALGVPVVASSVGNRPEGTIVFDTGNKEDLCSKIQLALKQHDHVSI